MAVALSKPGAGADKTGATEVARSTPAGRLWYVRRASVCKGPFPAEAIRRFIMLGRIRADDELSIDKQQWAVPARIAMFCAAQDEPVSPCYEERSGFDRRTESAAGGRQRGKDRRRRESSESIRKRQERQQHLLDRNSREKTQKLLLPGIIVLAMLGFIAAFVFSNEKPASEAEVDCSRAARPGVIWRACTLSAKGYEHASLAGSDLSNVQGTAVSFLSADLRGVNFDWAQLSGAGFSYAQMDKASLRGANLKGADLRHAGLVQADLSYADLRGARIGGAQLEGARLDAAIWIDGRTCASPSISTCQ